MARGRPALGAAGVVIALAIFAVAVVAPWASRDAVRPASVPSPPPLLELGLVPVAPGEIACIRPVVIDEHSARATFGITTYGKPGPPVRVRLRGRGYRQTGRIAGGYADNLGHQVEIAPPRSAVAAEACFRNAGRSPLALFGTARHRPNSRSRSRVEERPVNSDIALAFFERGPRSLVDRLPDTVERVTAFRPALVGPWLVWALLALVLLGVPAAAAWAVSAAARADERQDGGA